MPPEGDACKEQNSEKHILLNNGLDCNTCSKYRTAPDPAAVPIKAWVEGDNCDDRNSDVADVSTRLTPNIGHITGAETKPMILDCNRNQPRYSIASKNNSGCVIKVWDPQEKLLHRYDFKNKGARDWKQQWDNFKKYVQRLRPPYFILSFVFVVILVYLCANDSILGYLEFSGERRAEVWRLITYALAHRGAAHAALNAALTLAVGAPLEREQGAARTAAAGALGAVTGAAGAAILHPRLRLVGASAAVYSMLTSHLGHVCLNYSILSLKWFRLLAVALLALSDTVWVLWYRQSDQLQRIAWAAHGFGALTGFLLSFLIYKGSNAGYKYLIAAKWTSATIIGIGLAVIICFYAYPLLNATVGDGQFLGTI